AMLPSPSSRNARKKLTAMTKNKTFSAFLALLVTVSAAIAATSKHDLYLAAAINKNYVVGSKIVTTSGLFKRMDDGSFQHFGLNFPYFMNVAVDPRDHDVLYVASLNGALVSKDGGDSWRIAT